MTTEQIIKRVLSVILSSRTRAQLATSIRYAELAYRKHRSASLIYNIGVAEGYKRCELDNLDRLNSKARLSNE